jgi:hypothetical protein
MALSPWQSRWLVNQVAFMVRFFSLAAFGVVVGNS